MPVLWSPSSPRVTVSLPIVSEVGACPVHHTQLFPAPGRGAKLCSLQEPCPLEMLLSPLRTDLLLSNLPFRAFKAACPTAPHTAGSGSYPEPPDRKGFPLYVLVCACEDALIIHLLNIFIIHTEILKYFMFINYIVSTYR